LGRRRLRVRREPSEGGSDQSEEEAAGADMHGGPGWSGIRKAGFCRERKVPEGP
jgi:hypothetical protein